MYFRQKLISFFAVFAAAALLFADSPAWNGVPAQLELEGGDQAALARALSAGNYNLVAQLLESGADPNAPLPDGHVPLANVLETRLLVWDAPEALEDIAALLLEHGADPTVAGADGAYPLVLMVIGGFSPELIRLAAEKGARADRAEMTYGSALHAAVERSLTRIVEALLEDERIDPDPRNSAGRTPLLVGALDERDPSGEITRMLLERGADPEAEDQYGNSPLTWAEDVGSGSKAAQHILAHYELHSAEPGRLRNE